MWSICPKRLLLCSATLATLTFSRNPQSKKKDDTTTSAFIWGNGIYQARPGSSGISFNNFSPKEIVDAKGLQLQRLFLSEHFEGGLTFNGEVYVWDSHRLTSSELPDVDDTKRNNLTKLSSQNVTQVKITKGFLWVLNNKGEVYQYPIEKKEDKPQLVNKPRKVQSLQKIKQIETGEDHFVALDQEGRVFTMGDDTMGQCGQGGKKRSTAPPFYEERIRNPQQLTTLPPIQKISCGGNHTIAIGSEGGVYGWGSNSKMQLSQQQEYSRVDEPLIAVYQPIRLSPQMESSNKVVDVACGREFSVFVTESHSKGDTEVFGCGHNLKGELGAGFLRHISDVVKVEGLSNYKIKTANGEEDIRIKQIECGNYHCMALTSIGAVLEWGDNEYGQLGNKKRAPSESPIIMSAFAKEKVISIASGNLQSGVVVENQSKKS